MPSKDHYARPIVLREVSLLRALGASRRTFGFRRTGPGRSPLSLSALPLPEPLALLPAHGNRRMTVPDERP